MNSANFFNLLSKPESKILGKNRFSPKAKTGKKRISQQKQNSDQFNLKELKPNIFERKDSYIPNSSHKIPVDEDFEVQVSPLISKTFQVAGKIQFVVSFGRVPRASEGTNLFV